MDINKKFKNITLSLVLFGFLFTSSFLCNDSFVEAKNTNKKENIEHIVQKVKEKPTVKRWYINQFKKYPAEWKEAAKLLGSLNDNERRNENNSKVKKIYKFFKKVMKDFEKTDAKTRNKYFEGQKINTKESYYLDDNMKDLFNYFWNYSIKIIEPEIAESKVDLIIPENYKNKKVIFINPGFDFDEKGAVEGKYTSRDMNAKLCKLIIDELLKEKDLEVFVAFNLEYAGCTLPKHERLHIIDKIKGRPSLFGQTGKIYETSAMYMRALAKKVLEEKSNKFISICLHHDSSSTKSDVGFKAYYQVDEKTSDVFQKNSKRLCELLCKKCKDIFKIPAKADGKEIKNNIIREDWAMANIGDIGVIPEFLPNNRIGVSVLYPGYLSNKAQLKQLLKKSLQKNFAEKTQEAVVEYFKS